MKTFIPTDDTMKHGIPWGIPGQRPETLIGRIARKAADRLVSAVLALVGYEEQKEVEPKRADRLVLPMSSGVNVRPNTTAQITSRPQTCAFKPSRLVIGGHPENWIVNAIKIGNREQFAQSGDVPGEAFAFNATDVLVSFETVQTAIDFVLIVTYVGKEELGEPFVACAIGEAAF